MSVHTAGPAVLAAGDVPTYLAPTTALVVAAAVIGYFSVRARVVPIVGFLLAGVLIGPSQLGLVQGTEAVEVAAEIGVILLLFTIGIEFSLERLASLWRYIVVGGGLQVLLTTLATLGVVAALGAGWQDAVFTGFLVSLSSTAIVMKLLADRGETGTRRGQLALAVLIFQDLAVVGMVLVVPQLGASQGTSGGAAGAARALAVAGLVVAVVVVAARRVMPPVLERVARTCSQEVFLLTVVAICFGTAWLTSLAGVSVSLGAFLAGVVVSESRHSTHALSEVLPLQILFAAAFFVSVGMLLDVGFLLTHLPLVLGGVLAVLVAKVLATSTGLLVVRTRWRTAAATGLLLSQVGEFSFVLLTVGVASGLTPGGLGGDGTQAAIAGTVLLMALTPVLASVAARLDDPGRGGTDPVPDARPGAAPGGHVVVLGWGPAAAELTRTLHGRGHRVVATTLSPDLAAEAELLGARVVRGDSTRAAVLEHADVGTAALVVVAEDTADMTARVLRAVRHLTTAPVLARPADLDPVDVPELADAGADRVVDGPRQVHSALTAAVLRALEGTAPEAGRTVVDTSRVVTVRVAADSACRHGSAAQPVLPGSEGCRDCLEQGRQDWVHLRICLRCGHVGCCDSSPGRHATAHADHEQHPLACSAEPGEDWVYCYLDETTLAGSEVTSTR